MMIEIVAWVGSALVLVSYLQRDAKRLHAVNLFACVAFLVYDVALALHPMTALNVVVLLISAVQVRRLRTTALDVSVRHEVDYHDVGEANERAGAAA